MVYFTSAILVLASAIGLVFASSGDMTYYEPGLGACGEVNSGLDAVVALSAQQYNGANPCGRAITINLNGQVSTAVVVDKCMGCAVNDIDVSPSVFQRLASLDVGRIVVDWEFV